MKFSNKIFQNRTMAEIRTVNAVSQEVIEEEPIAEELTENLEEQSHVEEVNAENMAAKRKQSKEGNSI